jgi:hypothetical protein
VAQKPMTREKAQAQINAVAKHGSISVAARALGISRTTLQSQIATANRMKLKPTAGIDDLNSPDFLKTQIKRLEDELRGEQQRILDETMVRKQIIGLTENVADVKPPNWTINMTKADSAPGVPTLFLSDLHWGEVVHPAQINGVNKFNLEIAHKRLDALAERAVRLLSIISPKMDYPGLVLALGGDMVSGDIHEELSATNEIEIMPVVVDLFGELAGLIGGLADRFGRVFVPCVTGNHGRNTYKIRAKGRNHTSFDWLIYCFLAKHFERDKRVTFLIPDGPDAYYKVFNHRYLLTHGDQFRGGDGMIGALGPIIRGDHKKRSRNAQIDMAYDTMVIGHWHQYIHLSRLIVNGSLKGYDEYAYSNNFGFEPPQQALWLTHPKYGITYRMPVLLDRHRAAPKTAWASVVA